MRRISIILGVVVMTFFIAGCFPYPHTTVQSYGVRGRVLDARTHTPVQGARISIIFHPQTSCTTDSAGNFRLKEIRNFHFGIVPPEGDWPQRKYYGSSVTISHTNYLSSELSAFPEDAGDIFLKPK
jgi:hypothetical protein